MGERRAKGCRSTAGDDRRGLRPGRRERHRLEDHRRGADDVFALLGGWTVDREVVETLGGDLVTTTFTHCRSGGSL